MLICTSCFWAKISDFLANAENFKVFLILTLFGNFGGPKTAWWSSKIRQFLWNGASKLPSPRIPLNFVFETRFFRKTRPYGGRNPSFGDLLGYPPPTQGKNVGADSQESSNSRLAHAGFTPMYPSFSIYIFYPNPAPWISDRKVNMYQSGLREEVREFRVGGTTPETNLLFPLNTIF